MSEKLLLDVVYRDRLSIKPYYRNSRKNDKTIVAVADSIRVYGWQQPIVIDGNDTIVVGHARWRAAELLKIDSVPVVQFKGTAAEAREYRLLDNRSQQDSEWDKDLLRGELLKVVDLPTGYSAEEIANMLKGMGVTEIRNIDPSVFELVVECDGEDQQKQLCEIGEKELDKKCRVLTI